MVGRALEEIVPPAESVAEGTPCLRVRGLTLPGAFEDVDIDVGPGEIVGLAGLVGAGRSELLETLFGLHRREHGHGRDRREPRLVPQPPRGDSRRHRVRSRRPQASGTRARHERAREPRDGLDLAACAASASEPHAGARDRDAVDRRAPDPRAFAACPGLDALRRQPAEGRARQVAGGETDAC